MNVRCDTADDCGNDTCDGRLSHEGTEICAAGHHCGTANARVRCNPIEEPRETHTCYFCDHTGQDVNRIAIYLGIRSTDYCCDDAVACDERWQQLGDAGITARREERLSQLAHQVEPWLEHEQSPDDDLRQKIYAIIEEEVLNHMTSERMAIDSTNRIMKLIELLF